ncbi:hypothetical protein [Megasphaera sueciensis]
MIEVELQWIRRYRLRVTGTNGIVYVTDGFKKQFSDLNRAFRVSN